jgi:protein-S-isoprenylcysteine O-methyltransferase Ste14
MDKKKIIIKIVFIFILAFFGMGLMFFWPAGTLNYWQGWLFMGIIFIPVFFVVLYFLRHDINFMEKRMQYGEKIKKQRKIINWASFLFFIGLLIPGFDYRYGWSNVPVPVVIISDIIVLLAYLMICQVFKENRYASRIIEVQKGQKVISTGWYGVVRHPMYAGSIVLYTFMPLALGSYWALPIFIMMIPVLIFRILHEEEFLSKELDGYTAYMKKVKYRLIPGIW